MTSFQIAMAVIGSIFILIPVILIIIKSKLLKRDIPSS